MKTFLKYNLSFESLIDTPNKILAKFLKDASREEIVTWLSWNDKNGIYTDKESLKVALQNVKTVYHLAGVIYPKNTKTYYFVNETGTKNLVDACIENGVNRIL